jgi:hypothetical protein
MERLRKLDYRVSFSPPHPSFALQAVLSLTRLRGLFQLAAVHLSDASYLTDPSKYVSVLLLSLRTMLQLEMPHINVLSKMDVITKFGDLRASSLPFV